MHTHKIPFEKTNAFTPFFLDFVNKTESLKKFYHHYPVKENFSKQIEEKQKNFPLENRKVVVAAITKQYRELSIADNSAKNLKLLANENTFTITTGHQLNIFSGPLYFIYKIVAVINACKELKAQYPHYNFVPIYWMASEDHDYDEIKYFKLYGKKYTWETAQQGAVGRFHTKEFEKLLQEIPGAIDIFKKAYLENKNLADATRYFVNELFGANGLLVINGDDKELKVILKNVIKDDLFVHSAKKQVDLTNAELEALSYKPQIHCREINFFYLDDQLRSRIEKKDDNYEVVDTDLKFTSQQIATLIETNPEKFSPNVILRPVYQELILPNLAYVGGPAEIVYWLQLKGVFQHFNLTFPILLPRSFALVLDGPNQRKFEKSELELEDLFLEKNYLYNHFIIKKSKHKLLLNGEKEGIDKYFDKIQLQVEGIDKTLSSFVAAEKRRSLKSLEKIEYKILRAERRLQSDKLRQIESIKDSLFPNGSLQERSDNFLNFYQQDPAFIQKLINTLDPFDLRFNIIYL